MITMGPGNRANATIAHTLWLFIINLSGVCPGVNVVSLQENRVMSTLLAKEKGLQVF
jgi:hypothetical protein